MIRLPAASLIVKESIEQKTADELDHQTASAEASNHRWWDKFFEGGKAALAVDECIMQQKHTVKAHFEEAREVCR
jgi:hypothetical protein